MVIVTFCPAFKLSLPPVPALRVGKVGSRLGPQDLEGPQMLKVGPQTYWQTCLIVAVPHNSKQGKVLDMNHSPIK